MRVAVVGSGGVGGYFGGRLAASGIDVVFVARGAHLAALSSRGLRIVSPLGDVNLPSVAATSDTGSVGTVDIVFFTVKLYDTASARATLPPLVGSETAVISFQATLSDAIEVDIWTKFVWLSVFSGVTSVTRLPIGPLRDDPDLLALCQAAALEAMAVARARGVALPSEVFDGMIADFQSLPSGVKSSMLEDLERGRPLELPWLSGAVVRLADELAVPAPTHRFIATVLKPYVSGRRA